MAPKSGVLGWRSRHLSGQVHGETSALDFVPSIGEIDELKQRIPPIAFETNDWKRLKRFRRMLLADSKKDAVQNVMVYAFPCIMKYFWLLRLVLPNSATISP